MELPRTRSNVRFWNDLIWAQQNHKFTKYKREKRRGENRPFAFNKFSWSSILAVEYYATNKQ